MIRHPPISNLTDTLFPYTTCFRSAVCQAGGKAWDFALAAEEQPDAFAALLDDAGLAVQDRAPMTPVVKLVFGAAYDKTRLAEYACVLGHAKEEGLRRGIGRAHV